MGDALYDTLKQSAAAEGEDGADIGDIKARVYRYYMPVYEEVIARLRTHRAAAASGARNDDGASPRPMVVGVSAPQGCGKTTLTRTIVHLIQTTPKVFLDAQSAKDMGNITAVTLSMDDFYLTNEEQKKLGAANPENAMLQYRGNAGTHELELGTATLDALMAINDPMSSEVTMPRYDKLANDGWGDRRPEEQWERVRAPLDVILLEGWMLGFEPIDDARAAKINPDLVKVNNHLKGYKSALWGANRVNWWIIFKVANPKWVYAWRHEAERKAGGGLSDAQVKDFVDRFMPAYEAYLPPLYDNPPPESLVVVVDEYREVHMVHVTSTGPLAGTVSP
jgi:D-glycerate 3-kinase